MGRENLFCPGQKSLSKEGKENFDRIFRKGNKDASINNKGERRLQGPDTKERGSFEETNDTEKRNSSEVDH